MLTLEEKKNLEENRDRRCIHSYFCSLDQPQQINQAKNITQKTAHRIGKKGRHILDV